MLPAIVGKLTLPDCQSICMSHPACVQSLLFAGGGGRTLLRQQLAREPVTSESVQADTKDCKATEFFGELPGLYLDVSFANYISHAL